MFTAAPKAAEHIPSLISGAIRDRFTLEVPILTRSSIEWRALLEANPDKSPVCQEWEPKPHVSV